MKPIHLISDLPVELEIQTCTCRRRPNFQNNWVYSEKWNRPVHQQCLKPPQDEVIYLCANCDEYFISAKLRPSGPHFSWIASFIYIARNMLGSIYFPVKDVYCEYCGINE